MDKTPRKKLPQSLRNFNIVTDIKKFKHDLKTAGVSGLALDIDETLSYTLQYWIHVLMEEFGNPEGLTALEIIAKYRYAQEVPYWQTPEALGWMEQARNSNELHEQFPLIENADTHSQKINQTIPIVAYPTNRPINVAEGTRNWLQKHKFPKASIIARPEEIQHSDGNKWKAEVLEFLYPEVAGIVDDNPGLIDCLSESYPGTVFYFDAKKAPQTNIDVIACKTWNDVVREVQSRY